MAEIYSIPNGNQTDATTLLAASALGNNNGGFLGGNGLGGGILGFLLGIMFPRLFGNGGLWGNNGGGLVGNGSGAGTAYRGNMISNDSGRELLMNAITNQGEQSRTAIQTLSNMLGQDFNLVNGNIQAIVSSLNTIANNQGMNALQIINAIQSGDANLASQFAQCCCQNQLAMANMNAGIQKGFGDVEQSIAAKSAADQLSHCQQTYQLTETMNRNYQNLDNKIDALESGRKDREIADLQRKLTKADTENFIAGYVSQSLAPVMGTLNAFGQKLNDITCKLPNTVTLPYSGLTAVPTWQAQVGYDIAGSAIANRFFPSQADAAAAGGGGGAAAVVK